MVSFTLNKTPARTPTKTITFKSSSSSSSTKSSSSGSSVSRPATTPVVTKTITFKTTTTPTPSAALVAAAEKLTQSSKTAQPVPTKTIEFKTAEPLSTPSISASTKSAVSESLASAIQSIEVKPSALTPSAALVAAASKLATNEPQPVTKTIEFATVAPKPATAVQVSPSVQAAVSESLASAIKAITVGQATNNVPTASNSLLNSPALIAPKLAADVQNAVNDILSTANKASAAVAKRTDDVWNFNISQIQKTDMTEKIQTALQKAISNAKPIESFNALLQPQLSTLSSIAKAAVDTVTVKTTTAKKQNNADFASAMNTIAKFAASGIKSAKSEAAMQDVSTAANAAIDRVIEFKKASESTLDGDHSALVDAIQNLVKNSTSTAVAKQTDIKMIFSTGMTKAATKAQTGLSEKAMLGWKTSPTNVIKTLTINPKAKVDELAKLAYTEIYGDEPVKTEVWAERYATILKQLKQYANSDGTMNTAKAQDAINQLSTKLVVQQVTETTGHSRDLQAEVDASNRANPQPLSTPTIKDKTPVQKAITSQTSTTQAADRNGMVSVDSSGKKTVVKSDDKITISQPALAQSAATSSGSSASSKKTTATSTPVFKKPTSLKDIDPNKQYTTKSGNIYLGKDLLASDLPFVTGFAPTSAAPSSIPSAIPAGEMVSPTSTATEKSTLSSLAATLGTLGKSIGKAALPESYKVISFTPAGFTSVKSSSGVAVKVDTDIYDQLKETGYSDLTIANSLNSGKMGIKYDDKTNKVKIGMLADDPTNTLDSDSGLFQATPYIGLRTEDGKSSVQVPEWTYKKLQALGVSDKDIAAIPQGMLNQMNTLSVGSVTPVTSGDITGSLVGTTVQAALQLPGERKVESGLFVEVPRTAAQKQAIEDSTPNPAEHPLDYLLSKAVQTGESVYTGLVKPQYENGYDLQPTVAGLLKLNEVANDLSKPGATVKDVKPVQGLTAYETFTTTMQYADKDTLEKIAKNNPRLILGASSDGAIQPVIESKMGDSYWDAVFKSMTESELAEFTNEMSNSEKKNDKTAPGDILKSSLEWAGRENIAGTASSTNFADMEEYEKNQLGQLVREVGIDPITPYPAVNALLLPILTVGKAPLVVTGVGKGVAESKAVLTFTKLGDGGITAMRNGEVLGKLVVKEGDSTGKLFTIAGVDGSKTEVEVVGNTVKATEITPATIKSTAKEVVSAPVKAPTEVISGVKASTTTVDFSKLSEALGSAKKTPATATKTITFKATPANEVKATSSDLAAAADYFKKTETAEDIAKGPTPTVLTPEMIAEATKAAAGITPYKALTSADLGQLTDLGNGVYKGPTGTKYVKYGKDNYLAVADDYNPAERGILAVQDVDETGKAVITRLDSADGSKFHVTYTNADGAIKTVRVAAEDAKSYDTISQALQAYEDAAAAGITIAPGTSLADMAKIAENTPGSGLYDETIKNVEDMQKQMEDELAEINANLDAEDAGGSGGESGSYSSGGGGGDEYTPSYGTGTTEDVSKWTANSDWGAEIRSLDGGKTWEVKDPETGTIYSTTDYEKVATERIEARRSKYDSETNTYKKQTWNSETKALDTLYQDSAGGWVSKADLDIERAAIAANNPAYVYSVDASVGNARTRTLGDKVEYLDTDTGIWLNKEAYTTLKGSAETPIWNPDGYYYFRNSDGTFTILNPFTNAKQTPEEYAAYLASKNAAATAAATPTQLSTYSQPAESYSSYVPNLQQSYETATEAVASRAGGAAGTADAWTAFTQTDDFNKLVSGSESDLQILAKAKNGESLTEKEIARAQYLRSQMSAEGQVAFDAATGGETSVNLMYQTDFENLMRSNKDAIANMSDAEIKSSGLAPEKEIVVHQVKAEENMAKFFATDDFKNAPAETQDIIRAEIGYYAGEPSQISNLLNKFNGVKSTWTLQTSQLWDRSIEAIRSSSKLLNDMPDWWKVENADYGVAELALGKNKYADQLVTVTRNPTQISMESAYLKNAEVGMVTGTDDGWSAFSHTFKNEDGWVVRSADGKYSFIRKNDLVTNADEALEAVRSPLDMYFWEKPTNVPSHMRIPADADGSQIVAVNRVDAMSMGESEWAGVTASGGLGKDMTKEYVAIDLISPSGVKWTSIREADKAKSFQVGKYVDVVEQAPVSVAGKTGKDLQAMSAAEYRAFVADNAAEIRNLSDADLPYLTKYLDETRSDIVTDIRSVEVTPVSEVEKVTEKIVGNADLEREWKNTFKDMEDRDFRSAVANNMDDIEKTNLDNLDLTPKQRSLIEAEIKDRKFIRNANDEFKVIDENLAKAGDSYRAGEISASEYSDLVKNGIAQKQNIIDDVKNIQKAFDKRFNDVAPIECAVSGGVAAAGGAASTAASRAATLTLEPLSDFAKVAAPAVVASAATIAANRLFGSTDNGPANVAPKPGGKLVDTIDPDKFYYKDGNLQLGSEIIKLADLSGVPLTDGKYQEFTNDEAQAIYKRDRDEWYAWEKSLKESPSIPATPPTDQARQDALFTQSASKSSSPTEPEGKLVDTIDPNAFYYRKSNVPNAYPKRGSELTAEDLSSYKTSDGKYQEYTEKEAIQIYDSKQPKATTTQTRSASAGSISTNQINPEGYYMTKSGNTMRGKEIAKTDLPYIIRELTQEEINGGF